MDFSWKRELLEKITDSGELTEELHLRNVSSHMEKLFWMDACRFISMLCGLCKCLEFPVMGSEGILAANRRSPRLSLFCI